MIAISRIVNAFFRWEFNSCEMLVKGGEVYPIDYANACPDVALTSLHYYFPWAMQDAGQVDRVLPGHRPAARLDPTPGPTSTSATGRVWTTGRSWPDIWRLADAYFAVDDYREFCAAQLAGHRPAGLRLGQRARLRPADRRHRHVDLSRARAGALHRPLPRPHRPVGPRRSGAAAVIPGLSQQRAHPRHCPAGPGSAGHLPDPVVVRVGDQQIARGVHRNPVRPIEPGLGGWSAVAGEPSGCRCRRSRRCARR